VCPDSCSSNPNAESACSSVSFSSNVAQTNSAEAVETKLTASAELVCFFVSDGWMPGRSPVYIVVAHIP
jgi:hypothetical protein